MTLDAMARFRTPSHLAGDPARVLPRWTSEAAKQFRLPRRGTIAIGSMADLVLWRTDTDTPPYDLARCKPVRIILNGQSVDPAEPSTFGRFLGREAR